MTFSDIQSKLISGERIFDLPFRVVYYARVSTDSNSQINSLNNQKNYYENYIKCNHNWIFCGNYIDEGLSGVTASKRINFQKMISDAKKGLFDLIITKEVSRFARDLEDSIHYIRLLREFNVGIYFENQNLNTFDSNSELILNIMFNLAQEESKKLSSRIKFGHNQSIKKGHVLGSSNIIGYKKNNCKLIIVEEEAKLIKLIFETYATGKYGFSKLSKYLANLGYLNKNNNLYDKDTLKRIITNPKYKGYYRAHEYEVIDYRTKKRKKNNLDNQIVYKCTNDSIPKIVSEELWDKANEILNSRTQKFKNCNHYSGSLKYPLSSKIYCMEHNVSFQRSYTNKNKKKPIWVCGKYLQYRLSACTSPILIEEDLLNIIKIIKNKLINNEDVFIKNLASIYTKKQVKKVDRLELKKIEEEIKKIDEKKDYTLDLAINNVFSKESLNHQFQQYESKLKELLVKKQNIEQKITCKSDIAKLIKYELDFNILNDFIRMFISKIIVSKIDDDRDNIKLDIYLNITNYKDRLPSKNISLLESRKYDSLFSKKKFTINVFMTNY